MWTLLLQFGSCDILISVTSISKESRSNLLVGHEIYRLGKLDKKLIHVTAWCLVPDASKWTPTSQHPSRGVLCSPHSRICSINRAFTHSQAAEQHYIIHGYEVVCLHVYDRPATINMWIVTRQWSLLQWCFSPLLGNHSAVYCNFLMHFQISIN